MVITCYYLLLQYYYTGWCFGTNFMTFHSVGNIIIPSDEHIFQRGRYTTNQIGSKGLYRAIPPFQRSTVFRVEMETVASVQNVWIHAAFLRSKTEGRQQRQPSNCAIETYLKSGCMYKLRPKTCIYMQN